MPTTTPAAIVAVAHTKGGVGKTTCAGLMAYAQRIHGRAQHRHNTRATNLGGRFRG